MQDYVEFTFADGTAVALQAFAPLSAAHDGPAAEDEPVPGFGASRPVSVGSRVAVAAESTLRSLLAPLAPLLQQVHDSVSTVPDKPSELSVTFGVRVSQDLKLGIVGAGGEATMTVTAQWRLTQPPEGTTTPAGAATSTHAL
ncbi:CU044_2847 family protein [Streptomyces sp. NPDC001312]|uniref:CU044_2847 family protein n=1 Tax=Streptomyces sp. NPDC001312 TaxID=3364561 RepID=UPI0036B52714